MSNNLCKGCLSHINKIKYKLNRTTEQYIQCEPEDNKICPCITCLIKSMCTDNCELYDKYRGI